MSSETKKVPEISAEILRNTQDLAAQAAFRAQQMLRKAAADQQKVIPPDVPVRGDGGKAPEIPPKRQSLKNISQSNDFSQQPLQKPPPPLPQKPSSCQNNSPQLQPKFSAAAANNNNELFRNAPQQIRAPPVNPQQFIQKLDKNGPSSGGVAIPSAINSKLGNVEKLTSSINNSAPPNVQRTNYKPMPPSQQSNQRGAVPLQKIPTAIAASSKPLKALSPTDDFSSEDALRGIESGLRNMERAMQEQMNIRSMEAAAAAAANNHKIVDPIQFNPLEFKSGGGGGGIRNVGSLTSLDTGANQNIRTVDTSRMSMNAGGNNMRSMDRGFSMDQMRLENLHHSGIAGVSTGGVINMRSMESNPNIRSAIEEMKIKGVNDHNNVRPVEHHMRSLDRSLPLELQYSRHRSQEVVDYRNQLRQMTTAAAGGMVPNLRSGGLSREDLRMRRRSSHDENQISQGVPGNI